MPLGQIRAMYPMVPQKDIEEAFWIDSEVVSLKVGTKAEHQDRDQSAPSWDRSSYSSRVDDNVQGCWDGDAWIPTDQQPGKRCKGGGGSDTSGSQEASPVDVDTRAVPNGKRRTAELLRVLSRRTVSQIFGLIPQRNRSRWTSVRESRGSRAFHSTAENRGTSRR